MPSKRVEKSPVELGEITLLLMQLHSQPYNSEAIIEKVSAMRPLRVSGADENAIRARLRGATATTEDLRGRLEAHDVSIKTGRAADAGGRLVRFQPDELARTRLRLKNFAFEVKTLEEILAEVDTAAAARAEAKAEKRAGRFPQLRTVMPGWQRDGLPDPNRK